MKKLLMFLHINNKLLAKIQKQNLNADVLLLLIKVPELERLFVITYSYDKA